MLEWIKGKYAALLEQSKGWRTIIFGAIVGAPLTILQILNELSVLDLTTVIPPPWGVRIATAVTVVMILLRLITTGPVGSKGDETPADDVKAGD